MGIKGAKWPKPPAKVNKILIVKSVAKGGME
jgi:hypothetical protein